MDSEGGYFEGNKMLKYVFSFYSISHNTFLIPTWVKKKHSCISQGHSVKVNATSPKSEFTSSISSYYLPVINIKEIKFLKEFLKFFREMHFWNSVF